MGLIPGSADDVDAGVPALCPIIKDEADVDAVEVADVGVEYTFGL